MPRRPSISSFRAFSLDPDSPESLHRQLYEEMRRAILSGRLAPGSRLPASREFAHVSRISRNTVLSAYSQLLAEGYIESRAGSGTFVARSIPETMTPEAPGPGTAADGPAPASPRRLSERGRAFVDAPLVQHPLRTVANAFRPGLPALDHFPMDIYRRLYDRRLRRASVRLLTYDDPQGYLPLREAIAAHLTAARGARCGPEHVIVVNGSQHGVSLAASVLLDPGDQVWFEDPGYFAARATFHAHGARPVPVPVDSEGMVVTAGVERAPAARLAYVTPSHQNPLGVTMTLGRRVALTQWAERAGAWIIEDDNASEYRYQGRPLAAMQGIDSSNRVLYVGTFSKVMFSSLRLGYIVAPSDLVSALVQARVVADRQSPGLAQAVLADFMNEGHFARHVRRMRTLYAERLAALLQAVRTHAEDVLEVEQGEGGMSRVAWLPHGVDDMEVGAEVARAGIQCLPLSEYCMAKPERGGLILGFTGIDEAEIETGIQRLAGVVRAVQSRMLAGA
jgi:GntR family transcriptional regulator / MocR family aminotransferase